MAIGTYVLAGAALTKEYFDYKKSEADLERAEKKRKEGLILSPEEKKALQRMRTRAQTPIPEGRLFSQGARQITNVANQQKQQYMQQATPYMEGSVVAKSVADTIDVKFATETDVTSGKLRFWAVLMDVSDMGSHDMIAAEVDRDLLA